MKKILVISLLTIGISLLLVRAYINSTYRDQTRVFSSYSFLNSAWEKYKEQYINAEGRVIDHSQNAMTTSEGQSYGMLRAVWIDDKETFDLVWQWTKDNLSRPEDNLFGWNWGELEDGSYGFKPDGGSNFASDADSDIALALIFAAKRWNEPSYEQEAQEILDDLWDHSTDEALDQRYFLPGEWATSESALILNPSYFMPYSWRIFAEFDQDHDWISLVDPAYEQLRLSGQSELNGKPGVGLPPNWVQLDRANGALSAPGAEQLATKYSYDAMRIPWRVALDYQWFQDPQALEYLESLSYLSLAYQRDGKLTSTYDHDGTVMTEYESPSMYATALGYFLFAEPDLAENIYRDKIMLLYSNDTNSFNENLNYYDHNWLWFSAALYNQALPNLYQDL